MYFQDGTGDELNCVNGKNGAIGYADADNAEQMPNSGNRPGGAGTKYANTQPVQYNGVWPTRWNIRDGIYDNFWSIEYLYGLKTTLGSGSTQGIPEVVSLVAFANNPDKITFLPGNRGMYYASTCEMKVTKTNPAAYATHTTPTCTATSYSNGL
jgi:hypothetical protein